MSGSGTWKQIWDRSAQSSVPDFELDRGFSQRSREIETLSERELIGFIDPKENEILLDAGCGTGANILRLHSKVRKMIGVDFSEASVERCRRRLQTQEIRNVELFAGSITELPLKNQRVDKIICLSVLQYLDDGEVRRTLRGFAEALIPGGTLILHVKNKSSIYWRTLLIGKKLKRLMRRETLTYEVRSFSWYVNELRDAGFRTMDFNAFNVLSFEIMPKTLVSILQRLELRHCDSWLLRRAFVRQHGADLKIKAAVGTFPSLQ